MVVTVGELIFAFVCLRWGVNWRAILCAFLDIWKVWKAEETYWRGRMPSPMPLVRLMSWSLAINSISICSACHMFIRYDQLVFSLSVLRPKSRSLQLIWTTFWFSSKNFSSVPHISIIYQQFGLQLEKNLIDLFIGQTKVKVLYVAYVRYIFRLFMQLFLRISSEKNCPQLSKDIYTADMEKPKFSSLMPEIRPVYFWSSP